MEGHLQMLEGGKVREGICRIQGWGAEVQISHFVSGAVAAHPISHHIKSRESNGELNSEQ